MSDNKRKKYLFISATNFESGKLTGAHKRFLELVNRIAMDNDVILLASSIPKSLSNVKIQFFCLEKKKKYLPEHLSALLSLSKTLYKIKKILDYDYAISFGMINTIAYKICGYKHIITLLREDPIGYLNAVDSFKLKIKYFQLQERITVKASEKIIVQCISDRKELIKRNKKYCKEIESKVFTQINNANASWMKTVNIDKDTQGEDVIILFIGNFSDKRKGHQILLSVVAKLIDEGFNIKLLLAGDGVEKIYYQNKYCSYSEIKFLGRVNDMVPYFKIASFIVVPSLIDSCPNTVLEGLNAGIAVYGANIGGIPDLLENNNYLFEPNEEDLYYFLKKIIEDKCYEIDAILQKERKEELTFDWGDKIKNIIENNYDRSEIVL